MNIWMMLSEERVRTALYGHRSGCHLSSLNRDGGRVVVLVDGVHCTEYVSPHQPLTVSPGQVLRQGHQMKLQGHHPHM